MSTRYIFRLDDITPCMDWDRFSALLSLLRAHHVKPLLGVIPDNQDKSIDVSPPYPDFWGVMRRLQDEDAVDFAQHGYQHILCSTPKAAILGPDLGIKEMSEFAGFPYEVQRSKISHGKRILEQHGILTSTWMAPNHTFDNNTLKALHHEGFCSVTDGVAIYPYAESGLTFIPQQSWKPRWMPCGVQTICIHTNEISTEAVRVIRHFLRRPYLFSRFSEEVRSFKGSATQEALNQVFVLGYRALRQLKRQRRPERPYRAELLPPEIDSLLATGQPLP